MKILLKRKNRYFKQIIYYINRYLSNKYIKKNLQALAGFSYDGIHHHINIFGTYETDEIDILEKLIQNKIRKPKIALDIGANIGNHSVRLFSSLFKKVHCFEPHNEIFQLLAINTHKYKNISIHPFGLSNKQKKITLASDKNNMGATHIINVKKEREKGGRIAKVSEGWYRSGGIVKKLDQISNIFKDKIDLIKIDVEGHELKVLQGGIKIIKNNSPIIIFEESKIKNNCSSDTIDFLKKINYRFYVIKENFNFGNNKILKLLKYLLQDIFNTKYEVIEILKFERKFYNFLIAIRNSNS
jgi:FkbM family methyltransferase